MSQIESPPFSREISRDQQTNAARFARNYLALGLTPEGSLPDELEVSPLSPVIASSLKARRVLSEREKEMDERIVAVHKDYNLLAIATAQNLALARGDQSFLTELTTRSPDEQETTAANARTYIAELLKPSWPALPETLSSSPLAPAIQAMLEQAKPFPQREADLMRLRDSFSRQSELVDIATSQMVALAYGDTSFLKQLTLLLSHRSRSKPVAASQPEPLPIAGEPAPPLADAEIQAKPTAEPAEAEPSGTPEWNADSALVMTFMNRTDPLQPLPAPSRFAFEEEPKRPKVPLTWRDLGIEAQSSDAQAIRNALGSLVKYARPLTDTFVPFFTDEGVQYLAVLNEWRKIAAEGAFDDEFYHLLLNAAYEKNPHADTTIARLLTLIAWAKSGILQPEEELLDHAKLVRTGKAASLLPVLTLPDSPALTRPAKARHKRKEYRPNDDSVTRDVVNALRHFHQRAALQNISSIEWPITSSFLNKIDQSLKMRFVEDIAGRFVAPSGPLKRGEIPTFTELDMVKLVLLKWHMKKKLQRNKQVIDDYLQSIDRVFEAAKRKFEKEKGTSDA